MELGEDGANTGERAARAGGARAGRCGGAGPPGDAVPGPAELGVPVSEAPTADAGHQASAEALTLNEPAARVPRPTGAPDLGGRRWPGTVWYTRAGRRPVADRARRSAPAIDTMLAVYSGRSVAAVRMSATTIAVCPHRAARSRRVSQSELRFDFSGRPQYYFQLGSVAWSTLATRSPAGNYGSASTGARPTTSRRRANRSRSATRRLQRISAGSRTPASGSRVRTRTSKFGKTIWFRLHAPSAGNCGIQRVRRRRPRYR